MSHSRLTRKEIKKNELAEAMQHFLDYVGSHGRPIVFGALGLIVVAVVVTVGLFWYQWRQERAAEMLTRAMATYQAPVEVAEPKPDDPVSPSFATEQDREVRAKELFEQVVDGYGGSAAGKVAGLYLGKIALAAGDREQARSLWQRVTEESDDAMLAGVAWLNLIALDREDGRGEEVASQLETMLLETEPPLPTDVLLFEIGVTYEELGRDEEALSAFERIAEEFPSSTYSAEAQQRAAALGGFGVGVGTGLNPLNLGS